MKVERVTTNKRDSVAPPEDIVPLHDNIISPSLEIPILPIIDAIIAGKNKKSLLKILQRDCDNFNNSVDILLGSVDIREMLVPFSFPRRLRPRTGKRLVVKRPDGDFLSKISSWRWTGEVLSPSDSLKNYCEIATRTQTNIDVMTHTHGNLPNFEYFVKTRFKNSYTCANFVFEISPFAKHVFPEGQVLGHYEAITPKLTRKQLDALQRRKDGKNKLSMLVHKADRD